MAETIHAEDVYGVRSRVSWGAIVAGAFVALAVYGLLRLLRAAPGLSVSGRAPGDKLAEGVAVWAIVTALAAMFLGGWVASQLTAGESKTEAVVYGVLVWGLMFTMLLGFMAAGASMGLNAMIGLA